MTAPLVTYSGPCPKSQINTGRQPPRAIDATGDVASDEEDQGPHEDERGGEPRFQCQGDPQRRRDPFASVKFEEREKM